MKDKIKKKIALIIALMTLLVCVVNTNPLNPKAADVSVVISVSASSINVGDTVSVTVSVSGSSLSGYRMYVGYNSSVLEYVSCSGMGKGGGGSVVISGTGSSSSATITFKAIAAGTAGISTSGSEFYNLQENVLSVSHAGVNITVSGGTQTPTTEAPKPGTTESPKPGSTTEAQKPGTTEDTSEEEKKSDNSNLIAINVDPGELDKEFRYDITEYTVNVGLDTKSITVTPEKEDSTAKFTIEGADSLKPGANDVKITVVAENGYTKVYTLHVIVGELLDDIEIELNGVKYTLVLDGASLEAPDGFSPTIIMFRDFEIPACQSPNKLLTIVGLQEKGAKVDALDEDNEDAEDGLDEEADEEKDEASEEQDTSSTAAWFVYDSVDETFTPYEELVSKGNRFVVRPLPSDKEIPDGYAEVEINLQGKKVTAYHSAYATDTHMYLVYAMNINGSEGFYIYDDLEQTFLRYAPDKLPEPEVATVSDTPTTVYVEKKDTSFFTKKLLAILLFISLAGMILFATLMILQIIKKRQLKDELDLAESMVEQLVAVNGADKVGAVNPVVDGDSAFVVQTEETANDNQEAAVTEEAVPEITAEQKVVFDKAKEMAASILGTKADTTTVADAKAEEGKGEQKEEAQTAPVSNDETEDIKVDFIPEISLENYAETSKQIQDKINDQYDAQLDSAFTQTEDQ